MCNQIRVTMNVFLMRPLIKKKIVHFLVIFELQ